MGKLMMFAVGVASGDASLTFASTKIGVRVGVALAGALSPGSNTVTGVLVAAGRFPGIGVGVINATSRGVGVVVPNSAI
jgi:hypothetical protein